MDRDNGSSSNNYDPFYRNYFKNDTGLRPRQIGVAPLNDVAFPIFSKPQPVGFFCLDTQRLYNSTAKQLKYYRPPSEAEYPLDLNIGLGRAIEKPLVRNERLDHLLRFICDHVEQLSITNGESKRLIGDFVNYRGLLTAIMCTPSERLNDWCIHITRYKGTCYMHEVVTEQKKQRSENETPDMRRFTSYGYKFEQYCMVDEPFAKPNITEPVDECAEFSGVFHARLDNMSLLYGAEIDGILSDTPVSLNTASDMEKLHFIELKVQGVLRHPRQVESYHRFKTRNWWCQSFLVGINDIFLGTRDENGFVRNIVRTSVRSLPREAKGWKPNVCANFLVNFLRKVRTLMENIDCPNTVYEFYYNARSGRITFEQFQGKTEHSFLPDWYLEKLDNK